MTDKINHRVKGVVLRVLQSYPTTSSH